MADRINRTLLRLRQPPMSAPGQQRRIAHVRGTSASPLIPVELMTLGDGRNGPNADKVHRSEEPRGGSVKRLNRANDRKVPARRCLASGLSDRKRNRLLVEYQAGRRDGSLHHGDQRKGGASTLQDKPELPPSQ